MKKLIALVLSLACVLGLCACDANKDIPFDETDAFFVAKVMEVQEDYLLVEVTDKGNTSFAVGTRVDVPTNVTSADGCPIFVVGEYARVVFGNVLMEKEPPALEKVFRIDKTDATGMTMVD